MKCDVEMGTVAMIYECKTSFINIESSIQNLTTGIHTQNEALFHFVKIKKLG
jgi:hypothetical protein